jgi:LAO/AO transport system kinase
LPPSEAFEAPPALNVGEPVAADQALVRGVLAGERRALAKAITLLESTREDHRLRADAVLNALLPHAGKALRLGISGVPGVGKSTFIESLGLALIARGHKVAVLAIDPSSSVHGGSILGDKTRMEQLSVNQRAFVRPSPAAGTLGGVADKTREVMLLCEAAGHDVVIIETVGVGQSEVAVAHMTDMVVLLQLPNAGDDLQAIKKGVMELADLVVINKADLDPDAAMRAQAQITSALRIFSFHGRGPAHPAGEGGDAGAATVARWTPRVILQSALNNLSQAAGVDAFWSEVEQFRTARQASGEFESRRQTQALAWLWDRVRSQLMSDFKQHPAVKAELARTLAEVKAHRLAPSVAARVLLRLFESPSAPH